VRIDRATPGASVFVADDKGRPVEVLRFMHERASGGVGVWMVAAGDGRIEAHENLDIGPIPLVGETTWLRILATPLGLRCALSADGVHWASPWSIRGGIVPRQLGIALRAGEESRSIRIGKIAWSELEGLAKLAPEELVVTAASVADASNFREWRDRTSRGRPANVDEAVWRRAAAIAALTRGANAELSRYLVADLAESVVDADLPLDARVAALDDLSRLASAWDDPERGKAMLEAYAAVGESDRDAASRPYTSVVGAMIRSPIRSRDGLAVDASRIARREILQLVDAQAWEPLDQLCRELRFRATNEERERWRQQGGSGSLVDWAQMLARRHVPGIEGEARPAMHPSWGDVLVEQFNTDAFNVLAEFQSAIEGQAYQDAAETIAGAGTKLVESTGTLGVLPDAKEEGLYVSLRVAIEQAMRAHPGLESAMQQRFGPTALLRVRKAIAEGNEPRIESATLQYHGTAAAAEAHVWLGNRALSIGEFARALAHFETAGQSSERSIAADAKHRARLAGALAGRKIGAPAESLVRIGDASMAAHEFEGVIEQLVARSAAAALANDTSDAATMQPPVAPGEFQVAARGTFRLGPIAPPPQLEGRRGSRMEVDWFARSTALAVHGNLLLVNGRTSAAAFDTQTGARLWDANFAGPAGDARSWPTSCLRPAFLGEGIFVRWIGKDGPVLVCLDRKTGRQIWQAQTEAQELIVGDPFFAQDEVMAIAARPDALGQSWQLSLASFDEETGALLRARPLVRLAEPWREIGVCRATLDHGRLFIALGSVVVCCDLAGQVHWVRTTPHIPESVDSWSRVRHHDAPIVVDDRVFIASPTVRKVLCLEASSGRTIWQRSDMDIVGLAAVSAGKVVLRNARGLVGLEIGDGTPAWTYSAAELCEVLAEPGATMGVLIAQRADRTDDRRSRGGPELAWIDSDRGESLGTWRNSEWEQRGGQFGPVAVSAQGRLWGLRGADGRSESREVVELFPPGVEITNPPAAEEVKPPSVEMVAAELQQAADKTLAGWTVVSGSTDAAGTLVQHLESADTVLAVANEGTKVVFRRQATVAAGSKGRLRIKAGFLANENWHLHAMANDKVLAEKTIGGGGKADWERFELELAPFAGQRVNFEIIATSPDGKPRKTFWKRLEVTP
jgi:outer membrane protein assembly factor BamB